MAPDPADDPDLRARVEQLEATVEAQQATIEQLLPSRRRVLQAGGLVAGGGVLGALSADRASAQASGQVGTSSDPVDVEAFDLAVQNQLSSSVDAGGNDLTNVGSVNTDALNIGSHKDISEFEFGSISMNSGGPASDDTWGTISTNSKSVNFSSNFDSAPEIVVSQDKDGSFRGVISFENVSTSGFDITHRQFSTSAQTTIQVNWLAIN